MEGRGQRGIDKFYAAFPFFLADFQPPLPSGRPLSVSYDHSQHVCIQSIDKAAVGWAYIGGRTVDCVADYSLGITAQAKCHPMLAWHHHWQVGMKHNGYCKWYCHSSSSNPSSILASGAI